MLTLLGPVDRQPFCDRLPRRNFLKIGTLGATGLALPEILRAEAKAGLGRSQKSVILIYLVGGPPHLDMFDLKPQAPREVAGPFRPIKTNVPGIEICEHMPRLAQLMDRMVLVRSIADCQADHDAFQCYTGRDFRKVSAAGPLAHDRRRGLTRAGRRGLACRPMSAFAIPAPIHPTTSQARAFWAWPIRRFARWVTAAMTWCCAGSPMTGCTTGIGC